MFDLKTLLMLKNLSQKKNFFFYLFLLICFQYEGKKTVEWGLL